MRAKFVPDQARTDGYLRSLAVCLCGLWPGFGPAVGQKVARNQLLSARYERASLIVTSNKPFGRWGEVFGDDVAAAAMIDRLVHLHRRAPQLAEQSKRP